MCCITFCSTMYLHTRYLSTFNIPAKFQAVDFETWKKPPESAYFLLLCKFPPLSVVGKWNIPQWDGQIFSGSAIFRESIDWIMLTCNEHSMSYWSNAQATKDSSWHLIWTFGGDCYWLVSSHCMKFPLTCKISTTRKRLVNASPEKEKLTYRISWR